MVDTLPHPFSDEMKGIADVSGVPLGKNPKSVSALYSTAVLLFFFHPVDLCLFFTM